MSVRIASILCLCAVGAYSALAGAAVAQSMTTSSASFNGGYGRFNGQENHPVDFSIRDANGNLTAIDGILTATGGSLASNSGTASASASASGSFSGGVGGLASASATAIGNSLSVVTQGNYNTVIVNSTQINNGDVTANASAKGGGNNGN